MRREFRVFEGLSSKPATLTLSFCALGLMKTRPAALRVRPICPDLPRSLNYGTIYPNEIILILGFLCQLKYIPRIRVLEGLGVVRVYGALDGFRFGKPAAKPMAYRAWHCKSDIGLGLGSGSTSIAVFRVYMFRKYIQAIRDFTEVRRFSWLTKCRGGTQLQDLGFRAWALRFMVVCQLLWPGKVRKCRVVGCSCGSEAYCFKG